MENIIYKWSFSDLKNRWKLWYIIAISIIIWLVIWWILTNQYWLSFLVILVSWVMFFIENNSPEIIDVKINELWIQISESFYDFWKINSYSMVYEKEEAKILRLWIEKKWLKEINLKIDNKICLDLKNILPKYIKEIKDSELSKVDKFINLLKL